MPGITWLGDLRGRRKAADLPANLVPDDGRAVYGVLARATHEELDRLYEHAREVLGGVYLPRAVVVETVPGCLKPAPCCIA